MLLLLLNVYSANVVLGRRMESSPRHERLRTVKTTLSIALILLLYAD